MHPQQLRKKPSRPISSSFTRRASRPTTSYLKTRIRGSRLLNAARILALIELTQRLHQACEHAYDKQAADRLLPQNPGQVFPPIDLDKLKDLIQDRLNYGDCANYVASLINKAAELSGGKNPAVGTDMMTNFERIRNQPNGGISFAPPDPSVAGGGGTAEYRNGSVKIKITPLGYFADNPRGAYSIPFRYGLNGLHELIHGAGQNGTYSEADLTRAARALEPKAGYADWNYALKQHCLAPNQR